MEGATKSEMLKKAGRHFKEIREYNGYTQEQIARYLDVDRTLITKFEKGERSLSMMALDKAARLFGCETETIIYGKEYIPLAVAYRAKDLELDDMEVIAKVQQMALNLRRIKKCLRSEEEE